MGSAAFAAAAIGVRSEEFALVQLMFPSLFFHLAGCGFLLLFEKTVHPWRHLGKERESHCLGKLQGTKRGIEAEPTFWDQGGRELEVDAEQQHSSNQESTN